MSPPKVIAYLVLAVVISGLSGSIAGYQLGAEASEKACGQDLAAIECEARKQGCLMAISDETDLKLECLKLSLKGCND